MTYDTRAFGELGWAFVNAGEFYRKLEDVSAEHRLEVCGLFKQATMGDCEVEEAKKSNIENIQREQWLRYKGIEPFEAMGLYIKKVNELARIYKKEE